ncbi:competence damage-inducible protein A [Cellvibrio zantedeschiae]|uniref:Competence damage-inducible protein A n=1 Tax=Cellvibrio zantedeschiae TaxID=1237077 RepID=A0ABQ3B0W8_9GAMM|nr:CinA family protein [Cellvibrio zantedeschiae]GGY73645.1 competence damage-inducible protein A [Cellvibrio zantedeschiae]
MSSPTAPSVLQLSQLLGEKLLARNWRLATAESCTGGGIAAAITAVAGSSSWFEYGVVSYANQAKEKLLQVNPQTLLEEGAVSQAVVEQMAKGVLALSGAEISVAVSGIAGPSGGNLEKPVGTVWFAWGLATGVIHSQCFHFAGDRTEIQQQAVVQGLHGVLKLL